MATRRGSLMVGTVLFLFGAAAIVLALVWAMRPAGEAAAPSSVGGPFRLTDQRGEVVTEETLKGAPFVVFFGFTHCPDICPTTLFEMSEALGRLGDDAARISALFVTVDPERDTQEVMARYLGSFSPRIRGLTGSATAVDDMVKAYRAYYRKVPLEGDDYTMDHTAVVYLMDRNGRFVAPLNLDKPADELAAELRRYL